VADLHPFWTLIPIGILAGMAMLWSFGRLSNQRAVRETKRRLAARLYEFRLFPDEPKLIWQAQAGLVRDNLRYLGLMLVPAAALAAPMLLLFAQLDAFYGWEPLPPGRSANVTVQARQPIRPGDPIPVLTLPDGFVAETPAVRALEKRQISWRVRPVRAASGKLRVTLQGDSADKSISAGTGLHHLSRRRAGGLPDLLWYCSETPIRSRSIDWIEVEYPAAKIDVAGVTLHWAVCFAAISMAAALVFRRRFRVSF
jgi:hypothetical protein